MLTRHCVAPESAFLGFLFLQRPVGHLDKPSFSLPTIQNAADFRSG
jgi:hypothetical protein